MARLSIVALVLLAVPLAGCLTDGSPPPPDRTAAPPSGTVIVRPGDTVYAIARRHGVSMRAVIEENDLVAPFVLQVGQGLRLPRNPAYVVRAGDTIYGIAKQFDIEMRSLVSLNGIQPPYQIRVGQALKLPLRQSGGPPPPAPAPRAVAEASSAPPLPLPRPRRGTAADAGTSVPAPLAKPGGARPAPAASAAPRKPAPAFRLAALPKRGGSRFLWPVRGRVISNFGPRKGGLHNDGINIAAPRGTPILAADNGLVAYAGSQLRGFGKLLLIKHTGGWITAYAHADRLLVRRGDVVKRGQTIATIGASGDVGRPQLHFEVRRGSRAIDPRKELET